MLTELLSHLSVHSWYQKLVDPSVVTTITKKKEKKWYLFWYNNQSSNIKLFYIVPIIYIMTFYNKFTILLIRKLNSQNKDLRIKISSARTFPLIKILRRQARRERKVVRRRSRKRFRARYKFIITRASKHAAGFLARSRHFLFWTLSLSLFFSP